MRITIALTLWSLTALGCGSDSDPTPADADADAGASDAGASELDAGEPPPLSDVLVDVTYDGDREGSLIVAAFLDDPPMGPPLAFQEQESPEFPATVRLRGLEPNTYYVIAVLDAEPESRTLPGPEDLTVTSDPLVVDGEPSHELALTLTDP